MSPRITILVLLLVVLTMNFGHTRADGFEGIVAFGGEIDPDELPIGGVLCKIKVVPVR